MKANNAGASAPQYKPEDLKIKCAHCGRIVVRHWRGIGVRPTTCGKACQRKAWEERTGYKHPSKSATERQCKCGVNLPARRRSCDDCKRARRAKSRLATEPIGKSCRDCGVKVRKWAQRCEPCRVKALASRKERAKNSPSLRSSRSVSKARYKVRLRQSTVERFDPFEVFERDGWRCHMCGIKTPRKLRGTYEDNAPELDHIVPLAAGGEHSRKNTACSCRKCNITKSDKPLGQLRLVA